MSGVIPQPPEGFVVKDPPNLQHQLGPQHLPQQSQADLATRTTTSGHPISNEVHHCSMLGYFKIAAWDDFDVFFCSRVSLAGFSPSLWTLCSAQ